MADPAAGAPSSTTGAAVVSEQLAAMLLKEEDTGEVDGYCIPTTTPASKEVSQQNDEITTPPNRRPLFSSMREALESSGPLKQEPGGYMIKRHSGRLQQQIRSEERSKHRDAKHRSSSKGDTSTTTAGNSVEDEADAAGYTVIRRRMSCDESSVSVLPTHTERHMPRTNRAKHTNRTAPQGPHRPRRGSMSALPASRLMTLIPPLPSSSVPRTIHSRPPSRMLRPPPGLPPAASGWVVKAAAPVENSKKIEEQPVEALWPEMKATAKSESGWSVSTPSMTDSESQSQAWSTATGSVVDDQSEEDDLLTRLGVTL